MLLKCRQRSLHSMNLCRIKHRKGKVILPDQQTNLGAAKDYTLRPLGRKPPCFIIQ